MSIVTSHRGTRATIGPLEYVGGSAWDPPHYRLDSEWVCCAEPIHRRWKLIETDPVWLVLSRRSVPGALRASAESLSNPVQDALTAIRVLDGTPVWWWVEIPA